MGTIVVMLTREPMNTLCNWVELIGSDQFSLCAVSKPLISKSVSKCICKKHHSALGHNVRHTVAAVRKIKYVGQQWFV